MKINSNIITYLAILSMAYVFIAKSHADEKNTTENSARNVALAFIEKLAQYSKAPSEKLSAEIKSEILESKVETIKKMHEVFLSEDYSKSATEMKIYETTWEENGIAVCAIIEKPEHGFVDIDPLVLIKQKDGNGWKIAGSTKNAKMTELIGDRAATLDKLIEAYKAQKNTIKQEILSPK